MITENDNRQKEAIEKEARRNKIIQLTIEIMRIRAHLAMVYMSIK